MGPFHALKGKVEHNDEKTDVAKTHWDEIISEGAISCLIFLGVPKYFGVVQDQKLISILCWSQTLCVRPKVDICLVELVFFCHTF